MSERFSDHLREHAAGSWRRMQEHRFVRAIEEDRLPDAVFRRYLINEHAFVETAIAIFGYALVKAPDMDARRELVRILRGLTEDQIGYFEDAFAKLDMAPESWRGAVLPPAAGMLHDGMLGYAAHGGFAEIVTAMLAAEWTYHTFCERAARRPISDPVLSDWIRLHAEPAFAAQAAWLRDTVDRLAPRLSEAERRRLMDVFATALELEIHFHDAPFEERSQ
jgi:thiaminase/transcriptional activator TenA